MTSGRLNTWMAAAAVSAVPLLQGCDIVPPSFHDTLVYRTEDRGAPQFDSIVIRTGQKTATADLDADWAYHYHDDLDLVVATTCGAIGVSRKGRWRYLAYLHRESIGNYLLTVRTGFAAQSWSDTLFATVPVPHNQDSSLFFRGCPLHMTRLDDEMYGIVWVLEGELHSALYNPRKPPDEDLVLNQVVSGFEGVNGRRMSLTYHDGDVHLVWSPEDRNRIMTKRGTLSETGIDFEQVSTFTPIPHTRLSNAIAHDGALFVAASHEDGMMRLYSTSTGGTNWAEQASCQGDFGDGSLLYVDRVGDIRVHAGGTGAAMWRFTDCTFKPSPSPSGRITYHPGYSSVSASP